MLANCRVERHSHARLRISERQHQFHRLYGQIFSRYRHTNKVLPVAIHFHEQCQKLHQKNKKAAFLRGPLSAKLFANLLIRKDLFWWPGAESPHVYLSP